MNKVELYSHSDSYDVACFFPRVGNIQIKIENENLYFRQNGNQYYFMVEGRNRPLFSAKSFDRATEVLIRLAQNQIERTMTKITATEH